jgi:hypothetical protein
MRRPPSLLLFIAFGCDTPSEIGKLSERFLLSTVSLHGEHHGLQRATLLRRDFKYGEIRHIKA